ncbi:MAG: hypothetical protein Q7U82_12895 [Gammaproteobacteria bacterium]|nr:hypothetical protein [Gammaproteobacteria bacterium]
MTEGSARWKLVPDEDNPRKSLWIWDGSEKDDIEELFRRVRAGEATETDHELFDGCLLDRFVTRAFARETLEPWIAEYLANAFYKVMSGGDWDAEIHLPGRPRPSAFAWREQRALEIYCEVTNAVNQEGQGITEAISAAADRTAVSYETARADYYKWRRKLSKKIPKI